MLAAELLLLARKIAPDTAWKPEEETAITRKLKTYPPKQRPANLEAQRARIRLGLLKGLSNNVAGDIHTLLLVKQLWEQTLIYARYACKLD